MVHRHGGIALRPVGPQCHAKVSAGTDGDRSPVGARVALTRAGRHQTGRATRSCTGHALCCLCQLLVEHSLDPLVRASTSSPEDVLTHPTTTMTSRCKVKKLSLFCLWDREHSRFCRERFLRHLWRTHAQRRMIRFRTVSTQERASRALECDGNDWDWCFRNPGRFHADRSGWQALQPGATLLITQL